MKIIVDMPFKSLSFNNACLLQVIVCHTAMRWTFRIMHGENVRVPRLGFGTIEMVNIIEYFVVVNPLSTSQHDANLLVTCWADTREVLSSLWLSWFVGFYWLWKHPWISEHWRDWLLSKSWLMVALSFTRWVARFVTAVLNLEMELSSIAMLALVVVPEEYW